MLRQSITGGGVVVAAVAFLAGGSSVWAVPIVLNDRNSSAVIDSAAPANQFSWVVDGVEQLFSQSFHFRVAGDGSERNVNSLALVGAIPTDTNPLRDPRPDNLSTLYADQAGRFEIEINYTLRGTTPGSQRSDMAEQISITNLTGGALSLSFFEFVDLNLNGTAGDDFGQIVNGNTAQQFDAVTFASETVLTPLPMRLQVGPAGVLSGMLSDGDVDDLNNLGGGFFGDVAWAFQWDFVIPAGQSVQISKDKQIVPAPGAAAAFGLAALGAGRRRRRD